MEEASSYFLVVLKEVPFDFLVALVEVSPDFLVALTKVPRDFLMVLVEEVADFLVVLQKEAPDLLAGLDEVLLDPHSVYEDIPVEVREIEAGKVEIAHFVHAILEQPFLDFFFA